MNNLDDEIRAIIAGTDAQQSEQESVAQASQKEIHDIYVLIVREQEEEHTQVVDSTPIVSTQPAPITVQHDSFVSAYLFVCCSLFLIFATLTFQLYCMTSPLVATIIIIPTSQHVTLSGTMQLGRVLPLLTISQSQTTSATGHSHQDARQATGTVTFYNGLFNQQFIASGTVYTGNDGIEIVTTEDATIPPGNPGSGYGTLTVPAQAIEAGSKGNIHAEDVDIAINNGVLVKNNQFQGGQDERNFQTVSKNDIDSVATPMKSAVLQSMSGAFQGQLQTHEQLQILPCNPIISTNHHVGEEATTVKVTVSETCNAVAYNNQELETKATSFLITQAQHKAGVGYSLFGTVQVSVKHTSVTNLAPHLVFLSFQATGTWIYGISPTAQQQIKHVLAGKTTRHAQQLLAALPGIDQASIHFSGFGDESRIPKQTSNIHISFIVT